MEMILEQKVELLNKIEYWLDNEDIFWEWMESVVDEKLENSNENPDCLLNNMSSEEEQNINTLIEKKNVESLLNHLKMYTKAVKQQILNENIDEQFANVSLENNEILRKFQEDLEADFRKILTSENLSDYFSNSKHMVISLNSFEQRFVLKNKSTEKAKNSFNQTKSSSTYPSQTIQAQITILENKIKFLNALYAENKKSTQFLIEKLINDLEDCYAIFF